jgi:hypothetical protein
MKILITESQFDNLFLGKRVMVYYNLHKNTFSIQYQGKVIVHADYVKLTDVEFRVRKGGKEKVRDEKRKNVHAFVIGNLVEYCQFPCDNMPEESSEVVATYNPYLNDTFVIKGTDTPILDAGEVDMINRRNKLFIVK